MIDWVILLLGGQRVEAGAAYRTALLDICLQYALPYTDFQCNEDGSISFLLPLRKISVLKRVCNAQGVSIRLLERVGLPSFARRYRRRVGFVLGGILAAVLIVCSQKFVWDVRVYGNETMQEEEVIEELRACGFGVGSYIPDLVTPRLENRVLLASERIAWISIRMDGTVAVVQIIEEQDPPVGEDRDSPANLIASCDGQIEYLQLYRGNPMVVVGQAVRKGDLLVSGIYDSNRYGYRYTRAAGQVMARTEHEIVLEIPLMYEEKCYQEPVEGEKILHFFNFSLKFFKNSRNEGASCDIIKEKKRLELFGLLRLPLYLEIETCLPYEFRQNTRTHEQALALAYEELDARMTELSDAVQILQKTITTELRDASLVLVCRLSCVEDIAVQREFEITDRS